MGEEEVMFCQKRLPYMSFIAFEEMRKDGELCDVSLKLQHSTIRAHQVVLAAGIPYFRSLFRKGGDKFQEKEIAVTDLDPNAFESLIHFAYSSKVNISMKNAQSLLLVADFLKLSEVTDACVEFLSERLQVYNVLEVCTLAHNINNCELRESCNYYIEQNFGEFSKTEDYLTLPYENVKDIISRDELNVSIEENVFEAVINWVKFSPPQREDKLPDLLREVRMTSLSIDYLIKRAANDELIRSSTACRDLVQDVQSFHLLPEEQRVSLNLNTASGRGRRKRIYAICNLTPCGYSVYRCDFTNHTWRKLKSEKSNIGGISSVVACNEEIYVFLENKITTFQLRTLEWKMLESTHEYIEGSVALAHDSLIYFFGSHDDSFYNKVRCFDTCEKKWLNECKMKKGRGDVAVTSVEDTIYVTGGTWNFVCFNAAQKYNPSTRKWYKLQPMLEARSHHGCSSINTKIYVFGGISDSICLLSSSEVYDPLTNLWNSISSMRISKKEFSFAAHNNKIYAFGGITKPELDSITLEVESYDAECDQWQLSFEVPEGFIRAVLM